MNLGLFLLLISLTSGANSLDGWIERCLREGIKDIRKSMSRIVSDPAGITVENELRLQTRDMFIDLLQAVRGMSHYEIYMSFTNSLNEERRNYFRDGFATIFYTYPLVDGRDASGHFSQSVLEAYRLVIWSASMDREDDIAFSRILILMNELIREMAKHKWKGAEGKFIAAIKKRLEKLVVNIRKPEKENAIG